jgi:hypothetical protein
MRMRRRNSVFFGIAQDEAAVDDAGDAVVIGGVGGGIGGRIESGLTHEREGGRVGPEAP